MFCFALHNSILPYARLKNVTKSVTNWQTSAAFGIDTTSGSSLERRGEVAFFGERIPEWSPQAFIRHAACGGKGERSLEDTPKPPPGAVPLDPASKNLSM